MPRRSRRRTALVLEAAKATAPRIIGRTCLLPRGEGEETRNGLPTASSVQRLIDLRGAALEDREEPAGGVAGEVLRGPVGIERRLIVVLLIQEELLRVGRRAV